MLVVVLAIGGLLAAGAVAWLNAPLDDRNPTTSFVFEPAAEPKRRSEKKSLERQPGSDRRAPIGFSSERLMVHWDTPPEELPGVVKSEGISNIRREDYIGPDACRRCHKEQHASWSGHAHRWMNAMATEETVKGDFVSDRQITYQGATGTFFNDNGTNYMRILRNSVEHVYEVRQTLGSRFFQYFIGRGVEGPAPEGHTYYRNDHVLPFGYWLDKEMWVPVVHVADEKPDEDGRWNPLDPPVIEDGARRNMTYAKSCNYCHTTFPLADMLIRNSGLISKHVPATLHLSMSRHVGNSHAELWDSSIPADQTDVETVNAIIETMASFEAPNKAATLGISCEACHLGCRAHAEGRQKKPSFFPIGDDLFLRRSSKPVATGRTKSNVNWVCSRCHQGHRPTLAGGMSTWNSTEFSDADRGSCYSEMTCIQCHDPHKGIGKRWSRTPVQDDAVCLSCHDHLNDATRRKNHTHHAAGSVGDHCLNCHMPRINEGMQDVVRTHTIFSPNQADMLEAAHPNACNQCHLDRPIDWTLKYLEEWYGKNWNDRRIAKSYPDRDQSLGYVWLNHQDEAVRLIAADTVARRKERGLAAELLDVLDDPYLLNRQFAQKAVEELFETELIEYGYRFYMTRDERREPLVRIRKRLLSPETAQAD